MAREGCRDCSHEGSGGWGGGGASNLGVLWGESQIERKRVFGPSFCIWVAQRDGSQSHLVSVPRAFRALKR